MAEALRQRPAEYYNPRPLILGICFFWGVAAGFFLFHFSPPKQLSDAQPVRNDNAAAPVAPMSELERRRQDIPVIADVDLQQDRAVPADSRPKLETMDLDPPSPILTTEGGLTGKIHRSLRTAPTAGAAARAPTAQPGVRSPPPLAPPPIPELMP